MLHRVPDLPGPGDRLVVLRRIGPVRLGGDEEFRVAAAVRGLGLADAAHRSTVVPDHDVGERRRPAPGELHDLADRLLRQLGERPRLPVAELALGEDRVEAALQAEPRPGAARVDERLRQLAERLHDALALLDRAAVGGSDGDDRRAVELGRERLGRRQAPADRERAQLLGRCGHEVAPGRQDLRCVGERVEDRPDHHHRADRVRLELERGDDAEVAAGAADGPEQVLVLGRARLPELPVGGDDVDREQVVDREPVLAAEMPDPAVQRQPSDAGRRDDAARYGEPEQLRLAVEVAPSGAALDADGPGLRVDVDAPHVREVDHEPAVVDGVAGDVVPAALDREHEALLAREVDRVHDVGGAAALHDQRGAPVDQGVPDRARLVVAGVARREHRPPHLRCKPCHRLRVELRVCHQLVRHRFPPLRYGTNCARAYAGGPLRVA